MIDANLCTLGHTYIHTTPSTYIHIRHNIDDHNRNTARSVTESGSMTVTDRQPRHERNTRTYGPAPSPSLQGHLHEPGEIDTTGRLGRQ